MTEISVQPVRTFWHGELKTKRSPAFDVESGMGYELQVLGLVEVRNDTVSEKPVLAEEPKPVVEPEAPTVETPKKKAKPNAVDKDS